MKDLQREIVPIVEEDLFIVLNHPDAEFDYPMHYHSEYEINLVMGTNGQRMVGDSIEGFEEMDLALIGPNIGHAWRGDRVKGNHVITIQFSDNLLNMPIVSKRQFKPIQQLLIDGKRGLKFSKDAQLKMKDEIIKITHMHGFQTVLTFFSLLNEMSNAERYPLVSNHYDASGTFQATKSSIIAKVFNYMEQHYRDTISLSDMASLVGMSDSAFSHFFKAKTNMTFIDHLNNMRIAHACRLLSDTNQTISEVCYNSGFNNISNFIRMFKKKKQMTPNAYREHIKKF